MRVVQLVHHSLEEADELVPRGDSPQVGRVLSGDILPGGRLVVEVGVGGRDLSPRELEVLLEVGLREAFSFGLEIADGRR
jgi:hypothetical protein